jgi:DNA polymerase-3 subunit beta
MKDFLTIGVFGRRCGLSVSALRFYAECGLVLPVAVDHASGYRYYAETQLVDAVLVRRLRATEMPVDEIRGFLAAGGSERARIFELHAERLEGHLNTLHRSVDEMRAWFSAGAESDADRGCRVPASALGAGLAQVAFAISGDERRPELTGIWAEVRDGSLRLVATDSYRLAVRDLVIDADGDEGAAGELRALIGRRQADELRALCAQAGEAPVWLHHRRDDQLAATVEGHQIELGGADSRFPDYEQLLSGLPTGHRAVTARRPLTETLAAAGSTTATLTLRDGGIEVVGDAVDRSLPATWDGPPQRITINPAFLSEALAGLVGPDVIIEVSDPVRPVVLRSADTGTFTVWTMPIRPLP